MFAVMQRVLSCDGVLLRNDPPVIGGRRFPLPVARGIVYERLMQQTGISLKAMATLTGRDKNTIRCSVNRQRELREVKDNYIIDIYDKFNELWGKY